MEWYQLITQTTLVILKEGLSFVFSTLKDKKAAQKAQKDLDKQAQTAASNAIEAEPTSPHSNIKWNKVATLFWLGNDLMWIQDMTYRAAPPKRVLQGLNHAIQYLEALGFHDDPFAIKELDGARVIVQSLVGIPPSTEQNLLILEGHYRTVQQSVQTVKWYIDALATIQQPGFRKLRAI